LSNLNIPRYSKKNNLLEAFISKYFNKLVYYDLETRQILEYRSMDALPKNVICFGSQFEFEVFKVINARFPVNCINFHFRLELKPKSKYSGPISYVVDFRVETSVNKFLYIEAKGLMTKEASIKIKILEVCRPTVRANLIICSSKQEFYFGKHYPPSQTLMELAKTLSTF